MKKCYVCKELKPQDRFGKDRTRKDGIDTKCKGCRSISSKNFYSNNTIQHKQSTKKWISNNYERQKENVEKWSKQNPERQKQLNKKSYTKNFTIENRLKNNTRKLYYITVPKNLRIKGIQFLGCSIKDFIVYLEKQFDGNMSWENYGKYWEIDHIYPRSKGGIFHYSNTRPLSIKENKIKKDKV
tara:strand:- start:41 stop:592 length:552 start_codon:yes stop_codon:yes gene_type:complete